MFEDYVRPQENSSHYGCRYVNVSNGDICVKFTSDNDFSFNASEYTQEELAQKRHNYELEKAAAPLSASTAEWQAWVQIPAALLWRTNTVYFPKRKINCRRILE